jgi:glycosyltransferase involved in cell wall biosynthesis
VTLSLLAIVRNEAGRTPAMLDSTLLDGRPVVDELVLVDQGSTDETVRLAADWAAAHGVKAVLVASEQRGYAERSRNEGLAACSGDWILNLDADERLSPELAAALRDHCDPVMGGWFLRRLNRVWRGAMGAGGELVEESTEDNQMRLVRRARVPHQSTRLHTTLYVSGPVGVIPALLYHDKSVAEVVEDHRRYQEQQPAAWQQQVLDRYEGWLA